MQSYQRLVRRSIAAFFVSFALIFASLAARDLLRIHHEAWGELYSPYYTAFDFHASSYLGSTRIKLIKRGYDQEGMMLRSVKWLQGILYRRMQEKIPVSDGELQVWSFRFFALPEYYSLEQKNKKQEKNGERAKKLAEELLHLAREISSKNLVSLHQRQEQKPAILLSPMAVFH
jgi:hypothetical protein